MKKNKIETINFELHLFFTLQNKKYLVNIVKDGNKTTDFTVFENDNQITDYEIVRKIKSYLRMNYELLELI